MEKTVFVWIIDATRDTRWWDRLAFTMASLVRRLPTDEDVTFRVLDCGKEEVDSAGRELIAATYGDDVIVRPESAILAWADEIYRDYKMTEFCPAIFMRLVLPSISGLYGFDTIVSVDIDAEWRGGVAELLRTVRGAGTPFAMVRDPYWRTWADRMPFGKMPPRKEVESAMRRSFPNLGDPYFGAGLVCIRPRAFDQTIWWSVRNLVDLGRKTAFGWPEQDILNLAAPSVTALDPRFDVFGCEGEERKRDAYLIQYAGKEKPILDAKVDDFISSKKEKRA